MTIQTTLKPVTSYQSDYEAVIGLLNDYFDGLFEQIDGDKIDGDRHFPD
jgi:hypothetical protein